MYRIRELRKLRKITQKELAKHLQIADSTLSYWEMGRYEPDHESLKKLSKFFNVTIDYLFGDDIECQESYGNNENNTDIDKYLLIKTDSGVAESKVPYEDAAVNDNSDCFNKAVFGRKEFMDLTNVEIEKLAEYAHFLKTLRGNMK
jgi:transcriptional regulator with XRE-family HTH domain